MIEPLKMFCGGGFVEVQEKARRLSICAGCPIFNNGWCVRARGGCGCYMNVKATIKAFHCPIGKW